MQNSRNNIFAMKVEPKSQNHVNIFDVKHSGKPSTNIFSANPQLNNKELKSQSNSIFPAGKTPATNIFSSNSNPTPQVPNIFNPSSNPTPPNNIFASEKSPNSFTQVKKPLLNKSPITAFNFSTPIKDLSISKLDSANEEKKLSDNSEPNHIQLFSRSSSQKKIQNQDNVKKQEESFDLSSANDARKKQSLILCQMKPIQEKDQSREFQNLTFQKKTDSKKMENGEISFGDNLREHVNSTFIAEQKLQTPNKHSQRLIQNNLKEQKILTVIQEKQLEQSPFNRHEIQVNLLSSNSSTPSYMNQTSSPNLSYMDNVSSKLTTQKASQLVFSSVQKEQQPIKPNQKNTPFERIQIQIKTQSQNIIHVQKIQFLKQQQEAKQSEKISEPHNINVQNNNLDSLEARKQKRAQDFKSYLERNQTKKSSKQQFPRILIKRTQSQSDSQSHSFSSRDLGLSRHQQKSARSPFNEGIVKPTNIVGKEFTTTGTGGYELQRSHEKQPQVESKEQLYKEVTKFVQAKQPQTKPSLAIVKKQEQNPQKKSNENELLQQDITNSLDYSDTTQKIQSSTNTLIVKSLIQQQKGRLLNQYAIGKGNTNRQQLPNEMLLPSKNNEQKQVISDNSEDEELQVPLTNQRKFTFGKTFQIQNQLKVTNDTIESQRKIKQDKVSNATITNKINANTKISELPKKIQQNKPLSPKPLQWSISPVKQQTTPFLKITNRDSSTKQVSQKQQISPSLNKPSSKQNETLIQTQNMRRIKHEFQQVKKRIYSKIAIYKIQISSLDSRLKHIDLQLILNQHKKTTKNFHQLVISAFKSQNYYDLIPQQEIQTKIQTSNYKIQHLLIILNFSIKWTQKLKQISQTYHYELHMQKAEIQKQQILRKNKSFFTTFNIKRNKYCAKDSSYRIVKSDSKKPKKALQFLQSTLQQILGQKTKQYLNLELKCQKILKITTNFQLLNLFNLNQPNKIPVKSKISRILTKNCRQSQTQKIKNLVQTQLFKSKKVAPSSRRWQNSLYFKNIRQRFLSNLKNNRNQLKNQRYQSVNIQNESFDQEFLMSTKIKRRLIKNRYENLIPQSKSKIFFGLCEGQSELMSGKDDEELKKEQEIIKKVEANKDMNRLMHKNVSVKLKCINFKPLVFLL